MAIWSAALGQNERNSLTFAVRVPRGRHRMRELIVYVSEMCANDPTFGSVKLNKILYHSDFDAFDRFGEPITGMAYQKLEQGPAPVAMLPIRRELVEEKAIRLVPVQYFQYEQMRTEALRRADLVLFFDDELRVVNEVIRKLWSKSAAEVSDASHDIRWKITNLYENIPYETVALDDTQPTDSDIARTRELAEQYGWQ